MGENTTPFMYNFSTANKDGCVLQELAPLTLLSDWGVEGGVAKVWENTGGVGGRSSRPLVPPLQCREVRGAMMSWICRDRRPEFVSRYSMSINRAASAGFVKLLLFILLSGLL